MYIKCVHWFSFSTHLQQGVVTWSRPGVGNLPVNGQMVHIWASGAHSPPCPSTVPCSTNAAQKCMSAAVLQQTFHVHSGTGWRPVFPYAGGCYRGPTFLPCLLVWSPCLWLVEKWTMFPISLASSLSWRGTHAICLMNTVNCSGRWEGTGVQLWLESELRKVLCDGKSSFKWSSQNLFQGFENSGIKALKE